jgi:hypothetical protein
MNKHNNNPIIFDVPLKLKGHKIATETVKATYLVDSHGNYVIDTLRNRPYVVPVGYNIENTISFFEEPKNIGKLHEYNTEGKLDLQRGFKGKMYNGFVEDFKPIASFDFAIGCRANGIPIDLCKMGGGAVNLKNRLTNKNIDMSGDFLNNPENIVNIENRNNYYNKHYKNHIPEVIRQKDPSINFEQDIENYQHQKMHKPQKIMDLNDPEVHKQFNDVLAKVFEVVPHAVNYSTLDQIELVNKIYEEKGKDIVYIPSQEIIKEQTAQNFGMSPEQHQRSMSITAVDNQREKELGLGGRSLS